MNNHFGYTFKEVAGDMRIITITIVKIHILIVHLSHFILETAIESMTQHKLFAELVI